MVSELSNSLGPEAIAARMKCESNRVPSNRNMSLSNIAEKLWGSRPLPMIMQIVSGPIGQHIAMHHMFLQLHCSIVHGGLRLID